MLIPFILLLVAYLVSRIARGTAVMHEASHLVSCSCAAHNGTGRRTSHFGVGSHRQAA